MMKPLAAGVLLAATSLGALAQGAAKPWSVSGNVGLFSEYRFRGISQTDRDPALQGGLDLVHASGLYLGNWNSNVDSAFYNGANLEMDFYGGYKKSFGGVGLDVGLIHYYYPGSGKGRTVRIKNTEAFVGATWGPVGLKYYHSIGDFFSVPNSDNSGYVDLSFTHDLGGGFGLNAHVGHQRVRNQPRATGRITDWKVGATYDWSGYVLGAAYVDTNRDGVFFGPQSGKDLGKATLLLSVGRTF